MTAHQKTMNDLWQDSYLASGNEGYLEELYETYLNDPKSLAPEWQQYFEQLAKQLPRQNPDRSHAEVKQQFLNVSRNLTGQFNNGAASYESQRQERVFELILAYRRLGHLQANIDPLGIYEGVYGPTLDLAYYGFTEKDLTKTYNTESFGAINQPSATLADLYQALRQTYCSSIGFEYMHINAVEEVDWLRERIETRFANYQPSTQEKLRILDRLVVADSLEKYLGFKYVGQKRFSLEGGDSLISMLDEIIRRSSEGGLKEVVIGMAHRGRLNVLVNIVGKDPKSIFAAFEGKGVSNTHSGDVKYHLGCSSNVKTLNGSMHVALSFNPSHLEIVSPVVQGSVRSRQRRRRDSDKKQVLPVQIHGDAAFAGQGVVMETFNMSQTRWFTVGGSIHIVINNQVGFTTSNHTDTRSTIYCTDVAKMVDAPIFHVNANDPEAVHFAAMLAIDYRSQFKKDVVIDLVCYRRHGHNEADEPSATQPLMYQIIKNMPVAYVIYADKLRAEGVIQEGHEKLLADAYRKALDDGQLVVEVNDESTYEYTVNWAPYLNKKWSQPCVTAVPLKTIQHLGNQLDVLPEDFVLQTQVRKTYEARKEMSTGTIPINWGYAEIMAYATLLEEGYPIRLCGQDVARGTFAHRHSVLHDQLTDAIYIPLSHLSPNQAQINIVDSFLSEEAVLAFEYGYSSAEPKFLVIWEAQFGDFANGAQVVIDQFISSGEQKWNRLSGLVMLLPHGYEGQGPEHSSARLERYLQLCAQDNMQVCVPTTPSQIFHLLRRQMLRPYRAPLIVMTPKSLLRHPLATSNLSELTDGEFNLVIPEIDDLDVKKIKRVILTSGKIYYEMLTARREQKINDVAIIRLEQLYPFPEEVFKEIMAPYTNVKEIFWCQEEPQNQGAWTFILSYLTKHLSKTQKLEYVGRKASASPAVGYHAVHELEATTIINKALN